MVGIRQPQTYLHPYGTDYPTEKVGRSRVQASYVSYKVGEEGDGSSMDRETGPWLNGEMAIIKADKILAASLEHCIGWKVKMLGSRVSRR